MAKKTIMVVDDDVFVVEAVETLLKDNGYNVITARSGLDALTELQKSKVDLILLDMMMPGMNGFSVAEKIREELNIKDTKIVFLSILALSNTQKQNLKKFKISDYIQKPYNSSSLLKRIDEILKADL